jgi:hypothetical protein
MKLDSSKDLKYLFLLDKFRLKFRELFSSCCCCCKPVVRMKSTSSIRLPFKPSATSQQPSPMPTPTTARYTINNQQKRIPKNSLSIRTGSSPTLTVTDGNNMSRQTGTNAYTRNGPITFRLTNV